MEKLTEFVSKSFDPTKSALSVQYLAQSAARPDPVRSETPGGGTESDSSGPHDLRVTVPHPALPLGLPLDLPRYPTLPITSAGLPYPLPLLMAHRAHHQQLPPLTLHQHPPSPRSPSPPSPRHFDNPSPKRHRRVSAEDDRRSPSLRGDEEDEEVDVEASDLQEEAANLTLTKARTSSQTPDDSNERRVAGTAASDHEEPSLPIKLEPSENLPNGDTSVTSSQDVINNNSSSLGNKDRELGLRTLTSSSSPSPGSPLPHVNSGVLGGVSHPVMGSLSPAIGCNTSRLMASPELVMARKSPSDENERLIPTPTTGKHDR